MIGNKLRESREHQHIAFSGETRSFSGLYQRRMLPNYLQFYVGFSFPALCGSWVDSQSDFSNTPSNPIDFLLGVRKLGGGEVPHHRSRSEEHTSELQSLRHLVCR